HGPRRHYARATYSCRAGVGHVETDCHAVCNYADHKTVRKRIIPRRACVGDHRHSACRDRGSRSLHPTRGDDPKRAAALSEQMIVITPEGQPFADRRQALLARLRARPDAHDWCEQHTSLVDDLVRATTERVLQQHPLAPPVSVIATGGYGRRELAPHSDVDLTVVPL